MAEMEAAHRSHSMYSYLPRPNCKGCPWMSSFSTTETNSEPLIRYSSSREPFGSKLVIVNFVILEGSVTYSEYVLVFPAHRASASTILRSYRYLFPQKCNVIWTWDPLHSKGDKGVGPWQWDTLSTFHTLPSGSSHPDIALEKTAQGTPEMVTWRNNTLQEWDTTFQHAACTLNERTLCDAIPDRKNTSARYQTGKKKKKDDAAYHHSQWHTNDFVLTVPCRIRGTDSKQATLSRRENKDAIGTTSYGCHLST